jgi:hypothetical protein
MTVTVIGDFADPLSFLASQRVGRVSSLGPCEVRWLAVEADRSRPMGGRPLSAESAQTAAELGLPGEAVPVAGAKVPNSRAATAAYAESLTDGVPDAMRRALFDALWVHHCRIDDPDVIRGIVFDVLHPDLGQMSVEERRRADRPIVPLGGPDPIAATRRFGFIVSLGRGPLTLAGQHRIDRWRRLWQSCGEPLLPLLLTDLGEVIAGQRGVRWLADNLPHPVKPPAVDAAAAMGSPAPEQLAGAAGLRPAPATGC